MARRGGGRAASGRPSAAALAAAALAAWAALRRGGGAPLFAGGRPSAAPARGRRAGRRAQPQALQSRASLGLIKAQYKAGHRMKELGRRLQAAEFDASALGGAVKVKFDGMQKLSSVELSDTALEAAGGDRGRLSEALLGAMQEAYDSSSQATRGDVWELYQQHSELLQAPLNQIGAGNTVVDLWANVVKTEESEKLAAELFERFDEDKDGSWNLLETSRVQMATEGTEMTEEAFNSLIIAAAPDGGRNLTEEELAKGLSRKQVIELYTDAERQRQLGFVLDVFKDHKKVFEGAPEEPAAAPGGDAAAAAPPPPPALD